MGVRMRIGAFDLVGIVAVLAFCAALAVDLGALARPRREVTLVVEPEALAAGFREGVQWNALYREGERVGFSRLERRRLADGYRLTAYTRVDARASEVPSTLEIRVTSDLGQAFELLRFEARAEGDLIGMEAVGEVHADRIEIDVKGLPGEEPSRRLVLPLAEPPVFDFSLKPMLMQRDLLPGDRFRFTHFDPGTLASKEGVVEYLGREEIHVLGELVPAHHLRQEIGGQILRTWVNDLGEVLREELPLGLVAQRETEAEATYGFTHGGRLSPEEK
jgi:hypothetical protein